MKANLRKLWEMLTDRERQRFVILVVVLFLLSIVEAASVFSILPFLQLAANPDAVVSSSYLKWAYELSGAETPREFLFLMGLLTIVVTIVGLVMKLIGLALTLRFSTMRIYSLSLRLLSGYLRQPYDWFLGQHSASLANKTLLVVDQVVLNGIVPAVRMIPDGMTIFLLVAALFVVEPVVAISGVLVIGVTYAVIYLAVRKRLVSLGKVRVESDRGRFQVVQEAIGGAKELKLLSLEETYLSRYASKAIKVSRVIATMNMIGQSPRIALEAVAFGSLVALILVVLSSQDAGLSELVPTLGIIAAASMRLIPGLQALFRNAAMVASSTEAIEKIHEDLTNFDQLRAARPEPDTSVDTLPLKSSMVLRSVSYSYPDTDRSALHDVSTEINANATVGIVGGSGAGKTTFVDIVLGLLEPADGELEVDGQVITPGNTRAWQKTLGYVPQTIYLLDGTLAQNIAFGVAPDKIDHAAVEHAARVAALHDFVVTELPEQYDTHVGERGVRLSGGQRQRVGIARALYNDPSLLIFDEATSALDTLTEKEVMDAVHRLAGEKTIIMVAHRLSTVRDCDTIIMLEKGRIVGSGSFDELCETNQTFRAMAARA